MLLVYIYHLDAHVVLGSLQTEVREVPAWLAFVRAGHTGVSLFFVLSGFLLSLPFLREAGGGKRVGRSHYYQRRALRILPLYYLSVIVGTVVCTTWPSDLLHGLPYLVFLNSVAGWTTPLPPFSGVWWTLATEAQFYLVLPLLPLFLRSRRGRAAGVVLVLVYFAAYAAYLTQRIGMQTFRGQLVLPLSLFGRAPIFLCGIFVAWVYHRAGAQIRPTLDEMNWMRRGGADLILLAIVAALAQLLQWKLFVGHLPAEMPPDQAWHLLEGALWASVLALVLMAPLRVKPFLNNRVLGYLGIVSYSIYMWHTVALQYVPALLYRVGLRWQAGWNAQNYAIAALTSVVCLMVASLTYHLVERPFLTRKARLL